MWWWWRAVVAVVVTCFASGRLPTTNAAKFTAVCVDLMGTGGVGVRVWPTLRASPKRHGDNLVFRLLQINWEAEEITEGDWLGVFEQDPRPPRPTPSDTSGLQRLWQMPRPLFWDTPYASRGTVTTNLTQARTELSVLARGGCVGVFVGFVRNGVCLAAECQASHPSWLYDHRQVLGGRSLRSLVIPGTHNAGSFSLKDKDDVVSSWVVCQDEDIVSQLLFGIRYLDLRVAYYPDTPELLWVNHDLVRWRPLLEVLNAVRGFLAISPDPVIFDIHRTPVGFDLPEAVPLLLSLMNATLGSHFLHNRYGPHVTLDQIWKIGKRVIFAFADADIADQEDWVWPPLHQAWANAQLLEDLRIYLDAQMNKRVGSPRPWAAMAHLTPSLWDLILRSHVGVRGQADRVSFAVTRWVRFRWGHMANIVATDFFRGNDIISVAIKTNLALTLCRSPQPSRPPITFRRSTGFRIVAATRKSVYFDPTRPRATTVPPLFRRIYSPRPYEESHESTTTPTPPSDLMETSNRSNTFIESSLEGTNLQPKESTEPSLYSGHSFTVFSHIVSSMSTDVNGHRLRDVVDYPALPAKESDDENELKMSLNVTSDIVDPEVSSTKTAESLVVFQGDLDFETQESLNETDSYSVVATQSDRLTFETGEDVLSKPLLQKASLNDTRAKDLGASKQSSPSWDSLANDHNTEVTHSTTPQIARDDATEEHHTTSPSKTRGKETYDEKHFPVFDESIGRHSPQVQTTVYQSTQNPEFYSTQTPNYHSTQHSDFHSAQTPENHEAQAPDYHVTQAKKYHVAQTPKFHSIQTPEYNLTQTPEYYVTQAPEHHVTQMPEYHSTQISENYSTQTPENYITQIKTKKGYSAETSEYISTKTPKDYTSQIQSSEHYSEKMQIQHHYSTQTPRSYIRQSETQERHSTHIQTSEHYSTQTPNHYQSQTPTLIYSSPQTPQHYPTQTPTAKDFSTQTQSPEYISTQTQPTENRPTPSQTSDHDSSRTQTTKYVPAQTPTLEEEESQTQTPEYVSTQTQNLEPVHTVSGINASGSNRSHK